LGRFHRSIPVLLKLTISFHFTRTNRFSLSMVTLIPPAPITPAQPFANSSGLREPKPVLPTLYCGPSVTPSLAGMPSLPGLRAQTLTPSRKNVSPTDVPPDAPSGHKTRKPLKHLVKTGLKLSPFGASALLLGVVTHAAEETTPFLKTLNRSMLPISFPLSSKALLAGRVALAGAAATMLWKPVFKLFSEKNTHPKPEKSSSTEHKKFKPLHLLQSANFLLIGALLALVKDLPAGKFPVPKAPLAKIPLPTDLTLYGRLAMGILATQQLKKAFHWQPPPWVSSVLTVGTMTLLLSGFSRKSLKLFAKMAPFVAVTTWAANALTRSVTPWLQEHRNISPVWTRWGVSLLTLGLGTTAYMKAYEPFIRAIGLKAPAVGLLRLLRNNKATIEKMGLAGASRNARLWLHHHKATIKNLNLSNALEGTEIVGSAALMGELKLCPNGCTPQLPGLPPFCLTQTTELLGGKTAGLPVVNNTHEQQKEEGRMA
jgi:hypothetical protein